MSLEPINSALDTLNKVADLTQKVQEIVANFSLSDAIKTLDAKADDEIIKKIKTAFESIGLAIKNENKSSKERHLEDARSKLLDCINLNPSLRMESVKMHNTDVMAIADYGLAITYHMKNEEKNAIYYLVKAFQDGPRKARQLASDVYAIHFKPHIRSIQPNVPQQNIYPGNDQVTEIVKNAAQSAVQGVFGILAVGVGIMTGGRVRLNPLVGPVTRTSNTMGYWAGNKVGEVDENLKKKKLLEEKEQWEKKVDDECKSIASEYLRRLNF